MKKLTIVLIAGVLLMAVTACATDYYERYFFASNDKMYVTDMEFDILQTVELPSYTEAITFDGERWWAIYNDSEIYAFNLNGDIVATFPAPRPGIRGMAWDGECIWMVASEDSAYTYHFFERYPDGTEGPHGDFSYMGEDDWFGTVNGLSYYPDSMNELIAIDVSSNVWSFDRDGNYNGFWSFDTLTGGRLQDCKGLCYVDTDYDYGFGPGPFTGIICDSWWDRGHSITFAIYKGRAYGPYEVTGSEGEGSGVTFGRLQYEKLDEASFGKIKTFFTEK